MQNLILPFIRGSIKALNDHFRHVSIKWLPAKIPRDLRQRMTNMPFLQIYPSDAGTLNQLEQFFFFFSPALDKGVSEIWLL